MMAQSFSPHPKLLERTRWSWQEGIIILAIAILIFAIVDTASQFVGVYNPHITIETRLRVLPWYTAQTLLRVAIAYFLSLGVSILYAYAAYHSPRAAKVLIPLLDILQSIPILSFLPGVVLAMIALFPGQQLGVEVASIILIFVGMAWNMTFSFYQSLCGIPVELIEAAKVYRLNRWQHFWLLELPVGVIGLVWNSIVSVAGGWFFLMAIESFTLGHESFQLPGLGSYLSKASNAGDIGAIAWGLTVLISIIVLLDFFVWRPLIAWAEKFKLELVEAENPPQSIVLDFLRQSPTLRAFSDLTHIVAHHPPYPKSHTPFRLYSWLNWLFVSGFAFIVLWGTWEAALLLRVLSFTDWSQVMLAALFTMLRVTLALALSVLWAVPVGVAIARNPKLAKLLQPLVQIAASIPATALFPVLLLYLAHIGGGLEIGSVALMMMGSMWYVLFNVIAGAQAIPSELFEAAIVYKLTRVQRWKTLILPGIFPYLVTGAITAVGGAWNASIVSEYVQFQGKTLTTPGLGATISEASASDHFSLLLAATVVMSIIVVLTNRLVWRRLYKIVQEKYQLL
jgi:NitT/TauT family transport system permease protein